MITKCTCVNYSGDFISLNLFTCCCQRPLEKPWTSISWFVAGLVRIRFPKSRAEERKSLKVNKTEQVFLLVKNDSKEIWVGIGHWRRLPKPGKPKSETPRGSFFPKEPPRTMVRILGARPRLERRCAIMSYISPAGFDSMSAGNLMKARQVSVDVSGRAES